MPTKIPKIVVIGGGNGTYMTLTALKNKNVKISAVVSMADDGGSTGRLRDRYGVLPAGDVRRALLALSQANPSVKKFFDTRFATGEMKGHNIGNLFLLLYEKTQGGFIQGLQAVSKLLKVKGEVIPVTLDDVRLHAKLYNDKIIHGETNIDIPKTKNRSPIKKVWLTPKPRLNPAARRAVASADAIIIAPGDLFTSIIPNFLVPGLSAAVRKSKARKIYIGNLMTKSGETHKFSTKDFITELEKYTGKNIFDFVLLNNKKPSTASRKYYARYNSHPVKIEELLNHRKKPVYIQANLLASGKLVHHDPNKVGAKLITLIKRSKQY